MAAAVLGTAGCASHPHGPAELAAYEPLPALSVPAVPAPVVAPAGYVINPLDQLRIDVFDEPQLSLGALPVDTTGMISIPLAGSIRAEGRTAAELSRDISLRLNHYLRNPHVSVNITAFTSQKVTITGAVSRPGVFEAAGHPTLVDVVALAGGLNGDARQDEVMVFREINGQRMVARYDISKIQSGELANPQLKSGDLVVVGASEVRRLFRNTLALIPVALGLYFAFR
jgi:polysaccharide export outer membrane protein